MRDTIIYASGACRNCSRGWVTDSDPSDEKCSKCNNPAVTTGRYAAIPLQKDEHNAPS